MYVRRYDAVHNLFWTAVRSELTDDQTIRLEDAGDSMALRAGWKIVAFDAKDGSDVEELLVLVHRLRNFTPKGYDLHS